MTDHSTSRIVGVTSQLKTSLAHNCFIAKKLNEISSLSIFYEFSPICQIDCYHCFQYLDKFLPIQLIDIETHITYSCKEKAERQKH